MGYYLPEIFVSSEDVKNPEVAKEHIFQLCYVSAIIFVIVEAVGLSIFRERPPIPPT